MKTRHFIVTFCAVLLLLVLMPPATTVCAAAPAKVYTLKYWSLNPETSWQAEVFKRFFVDVKEKTDGQVILKPYWSASLISGKEAVNGLKGGLLDLGQFQTFNNPGEFPASDVAGLPFQAKSIRGVIEGLRKVHAEGLMPEYSGKGFQLLDFHAPGMQYLFFKDKQIDTLEQFKGLKIRSQTAVTVDMLKAFGATPVALPSTDLYMSLDRGVIDGTLSSPGFMAPFKLYEVGKFLLDQELYGGNMFVAMYQKSWDSLPADLQKIFMAFVRTFTDDWIETSKNQENINSKKILQDNGVNFYALKPGELEKMREATAPVIDKFIKNMDSLGLQGQKIVDAFKSAQPE